MAPENENDNASAPVFWERFKAFFEGQRSYGDYPEASSGRRGTAIAVCIMTSALLWFVFSLQKTYSLALDLPTTVVNLPAGQALAELPPSNVRVQVRGEGVSLFRIYYNRPSLPIDAGREIVNLDATPSDLLRNLTLESVRPRTYVVRTDERITRRVPIRLRAKINTPDTHELIDVPRTVPDSITVSGAASVVELIEYWPTVSIVRNGLVDSIAVQISLVDSLVGLVERDIERATLIAVAREFTGAEREVDVILEGAPSSDKLVTLEPSSLTVRYRVLLTEFNQSLRAPNFFATVRYEDIRSDTTGRVKPHLFLPDDLHIRDVQFFPQSLRYYNYLVSE